MALPLTASKDRIELVAQSCGWVKQRTANQLGITRPTLDKWIGKYGIEWKGGVSSQERLVRLSALYTQDSKDVKHTKKRVNENAAGRPFPLTGSGGNSKLDIDMGIPPVPPNGLRGATSVRIGEALWKRTRIEAIRRGVSASSLVEVALEALLGEDEQTKPQRKGRADSK